MQMSTQQETVKTNMQYFSMVKLVRTYTIMRHETLENKKKTISTYFTKLYITGRRFSRSMTIGTAATTRLLSTAAVVHARIQYKTTENSSSLIHLFIFMYLSILSVKNK